MLTSMNLQGFHLGGCKFFIWEVARFQAEVARLMHGSVTLGVTFALEE